VLNDKTDASPGSAGLWFDARRGSDKTFLKALGEFAAKSGHAELATVPWCLWGHSGGGIWSDLMTTLYPQRVVAVFLRPGAAAMFRDRPDFPQPKPGSAVYGVPIMGNAGVKEKPNGAWTGPLAVFEEYRAKDLILIDTAGYGTREMDNAADLARFLATRPDIDVHLALTASMKSADLARVARQFQIMRPSSLVFTRLDETETLGSLYSLAARSGRPLSFLGTGQQIPEDLEPASPARIVDGLVARLRKATLAA
jgi:hypothetical protein